MKLLEIAKQHNIKAWQLANLLDVQVPQIYKWNKEGIYKDNPHYSKLKEVLPELESLGSNKKSNSGRKKKELTLKDTNLEAPQPKIRKSERPIIIRRTK